MTKLFPALIVAVVALYAFTSVSFVYDGARDSAKFVKAQLVEAGQ